MKNKKPANNNQPENKCSWSHVGFKIASVSSYVLAGYAFNNLINDSENPIADIGGCAFALFLGVSFDISACVVSGDKSLSSMKHYISKIGSFLSTNKEDQKDPENKPLLQV